MGWAILPGLLTEILIPVAAVVGIAFALLQWLLVSKCAEIQSAISEEATSFLSTEYQYVGVFMVAFAVLVFLFLGSVEGFSTKAQPCTYSKDKYCKPALANAGFSTISFLLGTTTSLVSGFLGMKIVTNTNARTTLEARKGVGKAFITAFRSGLFESITGYGLGGSSMALFGRVGGGISTKAADVGVDLVGKVERNIPEDDPRNPASTALMTVGIAIISWIALPSTFTIFSFGDQKSRSKIGCCFSVLQLDYGLACLFIGFVTEYYTSNAYSPVQDVAGSCRTGAATNVIFGLALGYNDNAGGIAEMAGMSHRIRERTDALDAAGNTTAVIGKGFAIGSAALVSCTLWCFCQLSSYFHCRCSNTKALKMVEEVQRQFNTIPGLMDGTAKPDYATCVKISTDASIKELIPSGAPVMLYTPDCRNFLWRGNSISGSCWIAISSSNTDCAWDNVNKYIEVGASDHARSLGPKGSNPHKAAVIGDTIGDPLKDMSGPSLNILIKLMAVESLVFAPFFATHGGLQFKIF
ncbi:hypothetical protein OPV22_015409 [Ensete ventricosum]|uniref:H(+)-exporting diphosphatase n=1 Tax=Ensete ventricosum TaxID=4639 RepID=A0AAV8PM06_ENSVE|nr:hypothetical protein OPV22_015409 [Ensete ventricosum]